MAAMTPARRAFIQFLVSVAAVHVAAIVIYYTAGIPAMAPARQRMFAWVWMAVTVAVVFWGLQRIKRARRTR